MTTGSIQSASVTLSKHQEKFCLFLSLTNDEGGALLHGDIVYAKGNLTVAKFDDGVKATKVPIGIVSVGAADGLRVTVASYFNRTLKAHNNNGDAMSAGDVVRPVGTYQSDGRPNYKKATADDYGATTEVLGDWGTGIVLSGGNNDTEILVGLTRQPIRATPVVD